jgi:hypothetical protein
MASVEDPKQHAINNSDRKRCSEEGQHTVSKKVIRDPRLANTNIAIPVSNPFEVLSDLESNEPEMQQSQQTKDIKPPPIYLKSPAQFKTLSAMLTQIGGENSFTCTATTHGITIRPTNPNTYRKFINFLKENNAEYHTYQLKDEKAYRIVIRGLHHSIPIEDIKSELNNKGYTVRAISNVLSKSKMNLPLFFVDLEPNENNSTIFQINNLFQCIIKVEEPHKKRQIIQCSRCQQYGHSKNYCNLKPRCVRCGKDHYSTNCQKRLDENPTCANCKGQHPANYRGCLVHKELQRSRTARSSQPSQHKTHNNVQQPPPVRSSSESTPQNIPPPPLDERNFPTLLDSSSSNQQYHHTSNIPRKSTSFADTVNGKHSPVIGSDQLLNTMSNFILELKNLIFPIISLLSQITQSLYSQNGK